MSLPETHKALVLSSFNEPLALQTVPTPSVTAGVAIVRVLSAHLSPFAKAVYTGKIPFPMHPPLVPGSGGVGRIAAVGPDAVSLTPGQLVLIDSTVRARDDPTVSAIQGFFAMGPQAEKLVKGEWRNAAFAEYIKVPLENVHPLDEDQLFNCLGYTIHNLPYLLNLNVAYGGFAEVNLKPGETIVIAPATGWWSGAAVNLALGMGARVIAASRNEDQLRKMGEIFNETYNGRYSYVKLTGDVEVDTKTIQDVSPGGKGVDVFMDFSPNAAANSTHIKACILALKSYGRIAFIGGIWGDVAIPYGTILMKNLKLAGRFMYERDYVPKLIGMVEAGLVKLGPQAGVEIVGVFKLEQVQEALDTAEKHPGFGKEVVFEM